MSESVVPIAELPFVDSLKELGYTDRKRFGLIMPSGHVNDYRLARMTGQSGSRSEKTWNGQEHTCCGSRGCYRHKVDCSLLKFGDENEDA